MTQRTGMGGPKPNARYAELDDEAIVWMFETYGSFADPVIIEAAEIFASRYRPELNTLTWKKAVAATSNVRKRIRRRIKEIDQSII